MEPFGLTGTAQARRGHFWRDQSLKVTIWTPHWRHEHCRKSTSLQYCNFHRALEECDTMDTNVDGVAWVNVAPWHGIRLRDKMRTNLFHSVLSACFVRNAPCRVIHILGLGSLLLRSGIQTVFRHVPVCHASCGRVALLLVASCCMYAWCHMNHILPCTPAGALALFCAAMW